MKEYEINRNTLALMPINSKCTKVVERENEIIVNLSVMKIIDRSCRFFGSSYLGRTIGTKEILGVSTKAPIIIEESGKIIFFPTMSPRMEDCIWISLSNINKYNIRNKAVEIVFNCGKTINLNISYNIFDNQILRATRLYYLLEKRMI